jgi:hypothetical protein
MAPGDMVMVSGPDGGRIATLTGAGRKVALVPVG